MNKPTNPKDAVAIGKVSMSVLPANVMLEVATAMFEGASKYGRHNYRHAGVRASVYYDATLRHLIAWWEGEDIDDASSLSHITKAISSLVVLRDAMLNDMLTDDRPARPKVQIGKHIESLNEICASLIERHKDADVTHYTHAERNVVGLGDEPLTVNSACCSACGVPEYEDHRPNCEVLIHAYESSRPGPTNTATNAGLARDVLDTVAGFVGMDLGYPEDARMDNIARNGNDGEHYADMGSESIRLSGAQTMSKSRNGAPTDEQVNAFLRSCGYTDKEISWKDESQQLRDLERGYRQGWEDRGNTGSEA